MLSGNFCPASSTLVLSQHDGSLLVTWHSKHNGRHGDLTTLNVSLSLPKIMIILRQDFGKCYVKPIVLNV